MMMRKQRFNSLIAIAIAVLAAISGNFAFAETVDYTYDDLNRLIKVDYGNGLRIEYIYDEVGNVVEKLYINTSDTTPPVTTASPAGGTYNTAQTITLTCSDTGSGCDKIYYTTDGATPTTLSSVYSEPITISATTTLKYFATDLADNSEAVKSQSYIIDTIPPTGTITINGDATYTNNTNVTLTLSCADNIGCSQMQFSSDNATWSTTYAYAAAKSWTLSSGDSTKTVYVKFKDTAGNWSTIYSDTIILDATAPSTATSLVGGVYTSAQTVTLTCSDTGVGCDKIYYTTDGTTPTTSSSVYSAPITISATTTLKYFAKDLIGNSEAVKSQTYLINVIRILRTPSVYYSSIQDAYNAAIDGDSIQVQAVNLTGNFSANRNLSLSLQGGYSSDFTATIGNAFLKGMIQTLPGGGIMTIRNFVLEK